MYYPDRAEEDASLLTYTSAPLEGALRITGTPVVSLHLSSTHPTGRCTSTSRTWHPTGG